MMRITGAALTVTHVPVRRPHKMNIGTTHYQELVLVELRTDEGLSGWGEVPHMVRHSLKGESTGTVVSMLREFLIPAVVGLDPRDLEAVHARMARVPWNYRAKSGIDLACFDLAGKAMGVPAYRLLGGRVRDRVGLSWSIPIVEPAVGIEEAQAMVERGWRIIKVKLGRPRWDEDVAAARAIRRALPASVSVRLDANQAFDTKTAIRVARALEDEGLDFFEQPTPVGDLEGLRTVKEATTLPVMADESCTTVDDAVALARARAADLFSIYVCSPGGLLPAKKIAIIGETAGIGGYVGGALEGPLGTAAALHLAASSPGITLGCEQVGAYLLVEDLAADPMPMEDGALCVPEAPGLGVSLNPVLVAKYQVERVEVAG
ncbi:MAG: enolase C-terminal domain-like protein [Armatimonadota bacterium]|nr:enolase C-terminal domain-like protein [Armatimonadota bacterium]MDR7421564.1 enolase C-terminal domain-like protein [Armatimonadota bacterium]MDR7496511.1 enolase C-terminal domain-like protein [Armatimonadota bacterium]